MTKKYSKHSYRAGYKSNTSFVFLVVLFSIFVFVAFNIADIFSSLIMNKGSIFYNNKYYISAKTYYAVSLGGYQSLDEAKLNASQVALKGGAGYIHQSGDYYVILSLYKSRIDADSVVEKLKSNDAVNAIIVNVNIPQLTVNFSNNEALLEDMCKEFLDCYEFLYDLSIKFDSAIIQYENALQEIKNRVNGYKKYEELNCTSWEAISIKENFKQLVQRLNSLIITQNDNYLFNSRLKYTYLQIVFDYIFLCKSIS